MEFPKPKLVSFREKVTDIPNSKYLTHSLYYHPAKFIPQIVRYCLDNYCTQNGKILDPFAGSGTTALEAAFKGHDSYMLEINPLLDYFYPIKMPNFNLDAWNNYIKSASVFLNLVLDNDNIQKIEINGDLEYWYPKDLYDYFVRVWSNYHKLKKNEDEIVQKIVILVLFRLSKFYSYAEHSMPKLFISKRKREFIEDFLKKPNQKELIKSKAFTFLKIIDKTVLSLLKDKSLSGQIYYFSGVDSSEYDFSKLPKIDCIITSPPYLQAQEYMRTFKMEMRWSGISNEEIKSYMAKEIPFRKAEGKIDGEYINNMRSKLTKKDLIKMFDSYFWFMLKVLEGASKNLNKGGKLCVLIGNPKMEGIEIEIWKVIYEYFVNKPEFKPIDLFEDVIVSRKLFKGRKNLNPEGMKSEYLVILERV
jgi:hypothetical protein